MRPNEEPSPRRGLGRRDKQMRIEQLPDDVLRRYEREVLADPRTIARAAQAWLAGQGYAVSLAAVLRHRRRLAQARERDARGAARIAAVRELAAAYGLSDADLVAGSVMRARHRLLRELSEAYFTVVRTKAPAPPEQILAFARAVRAHLN